MKYSDLQENFWLQSVLAIILGTITIILLVINVIPYYYLFFTFVMWILISGLGIAVGYHRVFSHKTHQLPTWKENIILFFAAFAAQGSSIFWTCVHRGYHHPHADTERDLHSPVVYGKRHAFIGWLSDFTNKKTHINPKYAIDLIRKKNHMWFNKHQLEVLWGVPLVVSFFDYKLALCAFCLPSMISTLQDNLINVVGHTKCLIGYRNFETKDNSYNNIIFGLLAWGQGWHNNHHHDPKSFDFGTSVSNRKWEFDPCRLFLWFLKS